MPRPFNQNRRKNIQAEESTEPLDWAAFSVPLTNNISEETKPPNSVFDSVLEDNNSRPQSRSDNRNRRPNQRKNVPQKPKTDDHDKNDLKLNRSNILPHSPSDEVQVNAYINLLDEFIGNTENFVASSVNTSIPSMIDDFLTSLKNLIIDEDSKDTVLQKLLDLQDVINLKIKSLTDVSYNRTENWLKNQMGRSNNNLDKIEVASNKSDARSNPRSSYSAKGNAQLKINSEDLKVVNCQFCHELQPDLAALINHLDNSCQKFRDRDFDNSKRNDLSYFQILPTDQIKCNLCDARFSTLIEKKRHDQSEKHKEQVNKNKARDSKRSMTNFIFCSCCKVNVPDNVTQFKMHLENEEHIENKSKKLDVFDLAEKGTQIIIVRKNKVKCLSCHNLEFFYDKEKFQKHLNDDIHTKNVQRRGKESFQPVYCELCSVHLHSFGVDLHLDSTVHKNHLQHGTSPSETSMKKHYCIFCKKAFSDLKNMAVHQESSCPDIKNIRQLHQKGNEGLAKKNNDSGSVRGAAGCLGEDEDEDEEEKPVLLGINKDFFKDMGWTQKAAALLKDKADKCNSDSELDQIIADELAREVKCKKCTIYGSRNCSLALDKCDLNILCDFSTGTGEIMSKLSLKVAGDECYEILTNSKNFTDVKLILEGNERYITCEHINSENRQTDRICKIAFRRDVSELETDFFKNCMKNDTRIQEFLLLLKLWHKVHLSYLGELDSFVLMMLGVFFLRSREINVLPLPSEELKNTSRLDTKSTVSELFLKFCIFYSNFDYSSNMIHTGFPKPLPKIEFQFFLASKKLKGDEFSEDKSLWIASNQNSSVNVGKNVNKATVKKFAKACSFTRDRLNN